MSVIATMINAAEAQRRARLADAAPVPVATLEELRTTAISMLQDDLSILFGSDFVAECGFEADEFGENSGMEAVAIFEYGGAEWHLSHRTEEDGRSCWHIWLPAYHVKDDVFVGWRPDQQVSEEVLTRIAMLHDAYIAQQAEPDLHSIKDERPQTVGGADDNAWLASSGGG